MRHPDVTPVKRKHEVADLYGAVTLVDRGDGYFYLKQPIPEDDPVEQDSIVAFSLKRPGDRTIASASAEFSLNILRAHSPSFRAESSEPEEKMRLTYKLRLRDKHTAELNRQARAVSHVWNYLNETSAKAWERDRRWLSRFDFQKLTAGASKELDLHAHTIQRVCQQFTVSRDRAKHAKLRWRSRKSLGWVPYNQGHVSFDGETFKFRGVRYETMHMRDLPAGVKIAAGSFNADSKGRWYLNVAVEVETADHAPLSRVGIDLGLKDLAILSTGAKVEMPRFYRKSETALATAQRARKTKRARAIHKKIANRRKDFLHKASTRIAKEFGLIVVGDVSPSKLSRTRMAKSVLDAGWSDLKRMLSYKSIRNGGSCLEVSERLTSQTCSACGSLPPSRPRGIAGLRNRVWQCDNCGTVHDRDVNAARNILAIGLDSLAGGAHV